jgi:anti-sigma regulatory factor (Ser/Thr protein kinase)
MNETPVVELHLPARPEGVGVVRQALTGIADGLALDRSVLSDAKMAVTEACTNAVVHAYVGASGRFDVELYADEQQLTVVVRDAGTGIAPEGETTGEGALGLGLPLIQALSDSFELTSGPGAGTEVRMGFLYERQADPAEENPITGGPGPDGRWEQ